jgi:(S)-2-hydroxy-acid oxidase
VDRAEASGYKALVLTVDAQIVGLRRVDAKNKFSLPSHLTLANFSGLNLKQGVSEYVAKNLDQSLTWEDLRWLVNYSKLPVLAKGIMCKEDAELAIKMGAQGIIVSNHGGRHVDSLPASIEALPEIVEAVAGRVPVFLDGGVRQGTDIFKALALGAKMVFIGRPAIYGLAVNGQKGVEDVIGILKKELDIAMCLCGCRTINDITRDMVAHESYFAKL